MTGWSPCLFLEIVMKNLKSLYKQFYGVARIYWRDMQFSGLDEIEKSKRRAYEGAAQRVGLPLSLCDRLFATCFDDNVVVNGRMFEVADHIAGCRMLGLQPVERCLPF